MILVFCIAFIQIGLISSQIFYISKQNFVAAFLASIGISCCWMFNVNKAVKGNYLHKVAYTLGAAMGTVTSMFINIKLLGG